MTTNSLHEYPFRFTAKIEQSGSATFVASIAIVPQEIIDQLPNEKRIRVNGIFQNILPFNLAIQPLRSGEKYLSINAASLKKLKLKIGDPIQIEFSIADNDYMPIPEEFEAVLEQDELGKKLFEKFSVGYRRSILHYVSSAKSIDIRIKRSMEIIEKAKRGEFAIQKKKST
jgi:hypothetical protein